MQRRTRAGGVVGTVAALVLAGGGALAVAPAAQAATPAPVTDPTSYVNPFIGTQNEGNTYPGATTPFGMVQLSPDTGHSTGYDYAQTSIRGFSQVHLSGVGCGIGGFVPILPTTGAVTKTDYAQYALPYHHDDESASPGYYQVGLDAPAGSIDAELTATTHTGLQRYTFPATDQADVLIDPGQAMSSVSQSSVQILDDHTVLAATTVHGFCQDTKPFTVYTKTTFARPFTAFGTWTGDKVTDGSHAASSTDRTGAYLRFDTSGSNSKVVEAQTSTSYVDADGAAGNLEAEATTFDQARTAAHDTWQERLASVKVSSSDTSAAGTTRLRTFYSALYRTFVGPNTGQDVDRRYTGWDAKVHTAKGFTYYQDFSLWDTYRTQQQLLALLAPSESADMAYSVVLEGEQGGWAPRWSYGPVETNIMTGDPVTPYLVSAWSEGLLKGHEAEAYRVLKQNADGVPPADSPSNGRSGNETYLADGYVPYEPSAVGKPGDYDLQHGGSATLEYALADATLSTMAKGLGHTADAQRYAERGQNYRAIWDTATASFRARDANGLFDPETDPASAPGFHEGTAVQYQWLVQQDVPGLMKLMGGKDATSKRLDDFFAYDQLLKDPADTAKNVWVNGAYSYYNQDKYNPNNEPDLHSPYMYLWTGQPWKTTDVVRAALTLFTDGPTGMTGNDDLGEMSAWDVASSLGIFPIQPGSDVWGLSTPVFDSVDITLDPSYYPAGHLTISANGVSDSSHYVQSLAVKGKTTDRAYLTGAQLTGAGTVDYTVGSAPSSWATGSNAAPGVLAPASHQTTRVLAAPSPEYVDATAGGEPVKTTISVLAQGPGTRRGTVAVRKSDGISAGDPVSWKAATGGASAQVDVPVTLDVGAATQPGDHALQVVVRDQDGETSRSTLHVLVPQDDWLSGAFNNASIGDRGVAGSADFDGDGRFFIRDLMAGAGLPAGATLTVPGTSLQYVLGGGSTGPDNVVGTASPATTDVSAALGKAHQIAFVGAGAGGTQTGTAKLAYSDGSSQDVTVALSDWCGSPASGNVLLGKTPERSDNGGSTTQAVACGFFATAPVAVPHGKHLASITWPTNAKLHIFAVASDATPAAVEAKSAPQVTVAGSGAVRVGDKVEATGPKWRQQDVTTTYQWSVDGRNVEGATHATYTVGAGDLGKRLAVTAVGHAPGYASASSTSSATKVRAGIVRATAPAWISAAPDVVVGGKLTLHAGTYSVSGPTLEYTWYADGSRIPGATGTTLKLKQAQAGMRITAAVVVSAPGYADLRVTTGRTVPVEKR